jgi:peptidoglycan/LPS O-acetylase OafA/YrhL
MTAIAIQTAPRLQQGRILELDGLRAFAIIPVLLYHFIPKTGWLSWIAPFCAPGWAGVDLFFVLSGFLITGILLDKVGSSHYYQDFIIRRALRILPLYYACLALFTSAIYLAPDQTTWRALQAWGGAGWFVVYAGNIRVAIQHAWPPAFSFGPLWSLQVEEQFYLLYPLVIALCVPGMLRKVLTGAIAAALLLRCCAVLLIPGNSYICYVLTPCRMDALAMGGIVAILVRKTEPQFSRKFLQSLFAGCAIACVLLFVFVSTSEKHPFMRSVGYSVIDLTCTALLALLVLYPGCWPAGLLRKAPLVYIGQIAYGLYLLHAPVGWAVRLVLSRVVEIKPYDSLSMLVSIPVTVVVAGFSKRYFEDRFLMLRRRFAHT